MPINYATIEKTFKQSNLEDPLQRILDENETTWTDVQHEDSLLAHHLSVAAYHYAHAQRQSIGLKWHRIYEERLAVNLDVIRAHLEGHHD